MDGFLRSVARVILSSFLGYGLWIHIAVALSTALLVLSGADWAYYQATRSTALVGVVIFSAAAGFIMPVVGPLLLYFLARARQDPRAHLMVQNVAVAEMAACLIAAAYKAVTGRLQPNLANGADISRGFQFGILCNGIFWGWPSSHTIVAFSAAVVIVLSVRSRVARAISILYALIIGFGASVGFHWLSDVVAGALLGTLVALKTPRESSHAAEPL